MRKGFHELFSFIESVRVFADLLDLFDANLEDLIPEPDIKLTAAAWPTDESLSRYPPSIKA
ncbi:hypothetical protein WGT02_27560 (plasmid) [Rhizobium sp. T1470]|nr:MULTISPECIES: hypothetical protein [Rhizobium]MCA0805310.1 hypothetical protein [Rhizobium sp. T1473]